MKHLTLAVAALSFAFAARPLTAQEHKPKPAGDAAAIMTMDRATFVAMVTSSNAFEIRSSELANTNAQNADLKKTAEMIIADHKKAGDKLTTILKSKKVAVSDLVKLAPKHQRMLDQLRASKGEAFDTLYVDMQAQAHMEAIGLFRTYAGSGDDQEIVGFAKETLPRLETHLAHVKMLIAAM